MALTIQQKLDLLSSSKDSWIKSKSYWYAFSTALDNSKKNGDILQVGTIVLALITTLSGFIEISLLTIASGVFTTLLAFIEKQYVPVENTLNFANCKKYCEDYHSELVYFAIDLDSNQNYNSLMKKLPIMENNYKSKIDEQINKINVTIENETNAKLAFNGTTIDHKINVLSRRADVILTRDIAPELPEDAPLIIPVRRGAG